MLAPAPPVDVVAARWPTCGAGSRARARPGHVRIVAVTKGFAAGAVTAARRPAWYDIGENYAAELVAKAASCRA